MIRIAGTVNLSVDNSCLALFNYISTLIVAFLMKATRFGLSLIEKATDIYNIKINDSFLSIFILAIFLWYINVYCCKIYRRVK